MNGTHPSGLENNDGIFFILDESFRHKAIYGSFLQSLPGGARFFLGKTAEEIFGPEDSLLHMNANRTAILGSTVSYTWKLARSNGVKTYRTTLTPLLDRRGHIHGLVGLGEDVQDSHGTGSEADLTSDLHPLALIAFHDSGRVHYTNRYLRVHCNLNLLESNYALDHFFQSEDINSILFEAKNSSLHSSSNTLPLTLNCSEATPGFHWSFRRIDLDQESLFLAIGIPLRAHQIDPLDAVIDQYTELVENLPGVFYIFSSERGALYWSPKVQELLGFPAEDFKRDPLLWHNSIHPDDLPGIKKIIQETGDGEFINVNYRIKNQKTGKWIWLNDKSVGIKEKGEEVIIRGVATDISDFLTLQRNLQQKTEELQELNRSLERRVATEIDKRRNQELLLFEKSKMQAMTDMLHSIMHHWRQPLSTIVLLVEDLIDSYQNGEITERYVKETREVFLAQVKRLSNFLDNYKKIVTPDHNGSHFKPLDAIKEVVEMKQSRWMEEGIEFNMSGMIENENDPSQQIHGPRTEFQHVLLSILQNSEDAYLKSKQQKGRITLSYNQTEDGAHQIFIEDTHGGSSETNINRIFEPYFTTYENKTGLGLYLVRTFIEESLNGRIHAENTDHGLRVELLIPTSKFVAENNSNH